MMDCTAYRKSLLADPEHPSAAMSGHVADCPDCAAYTERLLRFESRFERALRVTVAKATAAPAATPVIGVAASISPRRGPHRVRGFAIAASVLLGVSAVVGLWLAAPGRTLAAAVALHMSEEPNAWARTEVPVPASQLDEVMRESGMHLKSGAGLVSYASSCEFRGHRVPHLVVQTGGGPITVMVLSHESVPREVHFDELGYRGMIVPVPGHGSLAVLERSPAASAKAIDAVAAQVLGAIDWTSARAH